ncbi:MAG: 30S ribosomal protein S9 [Candidatus Diapherotrites archaeon]|uniref:30S ribosomal protein S9 n=1 Tax=Candidatus Iainarchaeum sp. TaxID=3101447 RepID=A0A7J4KVH4_9ARCH|nr:30S ribosomal protein S9 [Candidatus Diapherotrites archaeon]HIH21272.1 30S ribosomal protein S9 [Candidatus Diapherotrites archaeon]HIH33250.1 30S ribosomal protein S9 [Candidatus Diapherotrites archaeon]
MAEAEKTQKKKKKAKGITSKSKKKTATARAVIRQGKGIVRINKKSLNTYSTHYLRELIKEPFEITGDVASEVDITVNVNGGGATAQALASRTAIAKALVNYFGEKKLKEKFTKYDRTLLVDDSRRKEPKKPLGRGARAKKQLSFR